MADGRFPDRDADTTGGHRELRLCPSLSLLALAQTRSRGEGGQQWQGKAGKASLEFHPQRVGEYGQRAIGRFGRLGDPEIEMGGGRGLGTSKECWTTILPAPRS